MFVTLNKGMMEARIKIKLFLLVLLLLVIWSCADPYYYDLYIEPTPNENSEMIDKILLVDDIRSNQALWRQSLVVRRSSYQLQYLTFKQWAKSPEELIKDAVIQYYKNSFAFRKVIDENSSIEPDILMRIRVDSLEMLNEEKQWFARLALDIEFVDYKTEKTFLTHYFDRKMRIEGKNPKFLPEKISRILQEELVKIIEKLK
ncbi:ABC-type transport auxiliary lipoprotein family protein [Acidobacteriota bacterium]